IGKSLNLYKKEGKTITSGINVKPVTFGNALKVTEVKRNEAAPAKGWHGYFVTLNDGTQWDGWFVSGNERVWAPGDSVVWAYVATPFLTPANIALVNLAKMDPNDPRFSNFGAGKFVEEEGESPSTDQIETEQPTNQ